MDLKSLDRYFLTGKSDQKNHQRLFNLDLLQEFLIENGCINPTTSFFHCQVYLYQQYHGQTRKKKRSLTEAEFHLMIALVSGTFELFDPRLRVTTETETNQMSQMTRPLTDYFIASSATSESILAAVNRSRKWKLHLFSDSAKKSYLLKQYRKLLEAGCRCLEIEIWDSRDVRRIKEQKKGSTDSLLISLSSVLTEINSFAVAQQNLKKEVAHLPIILSIDIKGRRLRHSTEAQEKLADQLKSTFKERLYTEPIESSPRKSTQSAQIPSPEKLKNYVFVKAVKEIVDDDSDDDDYKEEENEDHDHKVTGSDKVHLVVVTGKSLIIKRRFLVAEAAAAEAAEEAAEAAAKVAEKTAAKETTAASTDDKDDNNDKDVDDKEDQKSTPKTPEIPTPLAPSLAGLTNYFTTYPLKDDLNFQNLLQSTAFNKTISADESTFWKVFSADTVGESSDENDENADSNKSPAQPPIDIIDHLSTLTQSRLVHVYKDITIQNQIYDPLRLWAAGVQLVSVNWNLQSKTRRHSAYKTLDDGIPAALNEALFELADLQNCGYLLKPPWLISSSSPSSSPSSSSVPKTQLEITICSAVFPALKKRWFTGDHQQEEFAVEVKLYGSSAHCTYPVTRPFEWSTRLLDAKTEAVLEANCPGGHGRLMVLTWNESAQLAPPSLPPLTTDLTFVLFKLERNGQLYGRKMIALRAMQTGFRSIRLTDTPTVNQKLSSSSNKKNPAILVVNVQRRNFKEEEEEEEEAKETAADDADDDDGK